MAVIVADKRVEKQHLDEAGNDLISSIRKRAAHGGDDDGERVELLFAFEGRNLIDDFRTKIITEQLDAVREGFVVAQ